jgi:ketosteroid isomerase-like protein
MSNSDPTAALAFASVDVVLDELHAYAAAADGDAYFDLFTKEAVFLGTDATERWTLPEFRAYAEPYFARGQGWTYLVRAREIFVDSSGDTAWFDERLDNEKYGEVRGTGVLVRRGAGWKIAQYNLAFPVPNELAPDLVERIRGLAR